MRQLKQMHFFGTQARLFLVTVIGLSVLGGCATPASYQAMVPDNVEVAKKHPKSVNVSTSV